MEVLTEEKKGFKKTEVGLIPEDWEVYSLGKTSTLKARIGWQGLRTDEYLESGSYFLVTGTDFKNGGIEWDQCYFVDRERYIQDRNIQLEIDDILITKDGTIGKVAIVRNVPKPATLNSGVFVIRPRNTEYIPNFLYYMFQSMVFKIFLDQLTAGSTINHLYQKDFINFEYPLPPTLEEQQAIASALSDVDELIRCLDRLIDKKEAIKKGTMQQLLTGKKRLPGFDKEWVVDNVEELSKVFTKQTGFDYTKNIKPYLKNVGESENYPFIQNKDFEGIKVNLNTSYYIPIEIANTFPRLILNERCLLFSISGRVGNIGIYSSGETAFLGSAIAISKFHNPDLLDWAMWYLKSDEGQSKLLRNVKEGAHKNLTLGDIRKITIPFPSYEEQRRVTKILTDMDEELQTLRQKREKYKQVKQGMMQELLTGKTRLV